MMRNIGKNNRRHKPLYLLWAIITLILLVFASLYFVSLYTEETPEILFDETDTFLDHISVISPNKPTIFLSDELIYLYPSHHINISLKNIGTDPLFINDITATISLNPNVLSSISRVVIIFNSPPINGYTSNLYTSGIGTTILQGYGNKKILLPGEHLDYTLFFIRNISYYNNEGIFEHNYFVICGKEICSFNIITRPDPTGDLDIQWIGDMQKDTNDAIFYNNTIVDSWGSVRKKSRIYNNISIKNNGEKTISFYVSFYDHKYNRISFPSEILSPFLSVYYIEYTDEYGDYQKLLLHNSSATEYTAKFVLSPNNNIIISIYLEFNECDYHTFNKGSLYKGYISIYEIPNGPIHSNNFWVQI